MSTSSADGSLPVIRFVFWVAAIYNGILGAAFFLFARQLYAWAEMTPPNHLGYVRFPGALVGIFGLMFVDVALNPRKNRNLMAYGALQKLVFAALVFYYWALGPLPMTWKPLAIIDAVFVVLFLLSYLGVKAVAAPQGAEVQTMATQR